MAPHDSVGEVSARLTRHREASGQRREYRGIDGLCAKSWLDSVEGGGVEVPLNVSFDNETLVSARPM